MPTLPSELTIYTVAEWRTAWLAALDAPAKARKRSTLARTTKPRKGAGGDAEAGVRRFDAAAVEQIDAAGVQLLVALGHSLAARQQVLHLVAPSSTLRGACEALGAVHLLAAGDAAAAGACA